MFNLNTGKLKMVPIILMTSFLSICFETGHSQESNHSTVTETTLSEKEIVAKINRLDQEIQSKEQELKSIRNQAYKIRGEGKLEKAVDLDKKGNRLEYFIKDLNIELDQSIKKYRTVWRKKSWWKQIGLELGAQYTFFDHDLEINNEYGFRTRLHLLKADFKPFTLGYLYYPIEKPTKIPLRQIIASPLILEYRRVVTEPDPNPLDEEVRVNSFLIGYGLLAQFSNKSYLYLNLGGGIQRYSSTKPSDTGTIFSYTIGIHQFFGQDKHVGIALELTGDLVRTSARTSKTQNLINSSGTLSLRLSF